MMSILVPFDKDEAMTTHNAALEAARAERTIRLWCEQHGIGRRIAGGPWRVSRCALAMLLDGDMAALAAYRARGRGDPLVAPYFARCGLGRLTRAVVATPRPSVFGV